MGQEQTGLERMLRLPGVSNLVGRWIKVSNRGLSDIAERAAEPVRRRQAGVRLDAQEALYAIMSGKRVPDADMRRLAADPYARAYLERKAPEAITMRLSPVIREIMDAQSAEQQAAIVQEFQRQGLLTQPAQ
jgi:PAS domain-containing protein